MEDRIPGSKVKYTKLYFDLSSVKKEHTKLYVDLSSVKKEHTKLYVYLSSVKMEHTKLYFDLSNVKKGTFTVTLGSQYRYDLSFCTNGSRP